MINSQIKGKRQYREDKDTGGVLLMTNGNILCKSNINIILIL